MNAEAAITYRGAVYPWHDHALLGLHMDTQARGDLSVSEGRERALGCLCANRVLALLNRRRPNG
jgi:hypothetical protein